MPNTRAGGQETGLTVSQRPELHCLHLNGSYIYLPTQDSAWKQEVCCIYFFIAVQPITANSVF